MYRYIRAMSREKRKIEDHVCDKASEIDEHIMKLLLYPKSKSCDHWKAEIYGFLNHVYKLKPTHKFPKYKDILTWLRVNNDMLDKFVSRVIEDESDLIPEDVDIETLTRCIEQYQEWLATQLSEEGLVTKNAVYCKLNEIANLKER